MTWADKDWAEAWGFLTGTWPTLRRDGAEAAYRVVLTRLVFDDVAEAVGLLMEETTEEPKPADIAARTRRVVTDRDRAHRPVRVPANLPDLPDDDEASPRPATLRDALDIAEDRRSRGASLSFTQWVALGCPSRDPHDDPDATLAKVARLVADDAPPVVGAGPDPDNPHSRPAVRVVGSLGPALRGAIRVASDPNRALALRRLGHHMPPDDHAVLTDAVTP